MGNVVDLILEHLDISRYPGVSPQCQQTIEMLKTHYPNFFEGGYVSVVVGEYSIHPEVRTYKEILDAWQHDEVLVQGLKIPTQEWEKFRPGLRIYRRSV